MSASWDRMAMASAAVVVLLGFNTLEITASRISNDLSLPAVLTWPNSHETNAPGRDFVVTQGCLLSLELGPRPDCWQGR